LNGFASDFFPLQRGIRQDCPLSGLLFVLTVEMLAQEIRNNTIIKGSTSEFIYANATTIFLKVESSATQCTI
jgi:hypothetical protein